MNSLGNNGARAPDVVVIGGGAIGCSIAYYLQKGGLRVTLVERNELCSGASGSNQGGATFSRTLPPFTELAKKSQEMFENLEEELGYDIDMEEVSFLLCAVDMNSEKESLLNKTFEEIREIGTECHLLLGNELRRLDMPFCPNVQGAIEITKGIYILWPFKLVLAFAHAAETLGARILTFTEVKDIKVKNNRVSSVVTNRGELKPKYIVNAAGAWSNKIGEMVGLDIPVKPQRGQLLVTEATRLYPCRYLMDIDYLMIEHSQREKLEVSTNLVQHKKGNWTIGSSRELAGFINKTTPEGMALLARKAIKFLLDLPLEHCIRSYSGLRPFCHVDGNPILGEVDKIKGFVIATGHGGSGIKFAPVNGKLIAEEIIKGEPPTLLAPYRYSRFV